MTFWLGYLCGGCSWMLFWLVFMRWDTNRKRKQIRRLVDVESIFEDRRRE